MFKLPLPNAGKCYYKEGRDSIGKNDLSGRNSLETK